LASFCPSRSPSSQVQHRCTVVLTMCRDGAPQPQVFRSSPKDTLVWCLEEKDEAWRLTVATRTMPEVELSDEAIRLRIGDDVTATTLEVPKLAQPLESSSACVKFSRRRGELVVTWPISCINAELASPVLQKESGKPCPPDQESGYQTPQEASAQEAGKVEEVAVEQTATQMPQPIGGPTALGEVVEVEEPSSADQKHEDLTAEEPVICTVSAEEWKARGNEAVKVGDLETAIHHYSSGLQVGGGDEAVLYSNRAHCFCKLERYEDALADARRCVALRPEFVKGFLRGAMALRSLGRPEEALAFLKRCPKHDEAGKLATELRPEAEAAEKTRIAALGGAERLKEEGNALFKKGLFDDAVAKYSKALALCSDQEDDLKITLQNNRAACYHQLSDFHAVVKDTTAVLNRHPKNFKALNRRMLALEPMERYEEALADARAVLRQDPRHETANRMQHRLGRLVRDNCQSHGGA